jgi:hypothetical protein
VRDAGEDVEGVRGNRKVYYAAILSGALALRLLMVCSVAKGDPRFWFFNQASEYGCLAQSMLSGHGYASPFCGSTGPSAFLAPGYPLLVTAIFRLFGSYSVSSAAVLILLQTIFCELTVLVVILLAKRILGTTFANRAGILYAISPPALGLPVLFWETSLSMLLLTGVILAAIGCVDHPRIRNWIAFGAYCAAAMLINPSLFPTFFAVLGWMAWRSKAHWRGAAFAFVTWCALYSVWPIGNQIRMHAFIPMRTNLGYELWQGNQLGSDGAFNFALHPNASDYEYSHYARVGEINYMHEKMVLAVAGIEADKMRFARLSLTRISKFWVNTTEYRFSSMLTLNIAMTSLMGVAGLVLLLRRRSSFGYLLTIPFAVLPLPYYLTHADFRFRLLLDPLAMVLTVLVIEECLMLFRAQQDRAHKGDKIEIQDSPATV